MAIRKSKINIDTEERSNFDNMMNDVENEVEEQQAEDGLVNRVPELKQLSEDIDKATNTFINATLELESAIQQYQRAEVQLGINIFSFIANRDMQMFPSTATCVAGDTYYIPSLDCLPL